ncbi:MAG: hypothetical protein P8Z37_06280 [Acidobacteriota bacterium]|jgi:hypothetical protein
MMLTIDGSTADYVTNSGMEHCSISKVQSNAGVTVDRTEDRNADIEIEDLVRQERMPRESAQGIPGAIPFYRIRSGPVGSAG